LPLLEETGYIPEEKYSFGDEIRAHARRTRRFRFSILQSYSQSHGACVGGANLEPSGEDDAVHLVLDAVEQQPGFGHPVDAAAKRRRSGSDRWPGQIATNKYLSIVQIKV
jgi:hypothetical protein